MGEYQKRSRIKKLNQNRRKFDTIYKAFSIGNGYFSDEKSLKDEDCKYLLCLGFKPEWIKSSGAFSFPYVEMLPILAKEMDSLGLLDTLKETPGFNYYEPGDAWYYEDAGNHIAFPLKNVEGRIFSFYCVENYSTRIYSSHFVNNEEVESTEKKYIFSEEYQPTDEEGFGFGTYYNIDLYSNFLPAVSLVNKADINKNSNTLALVYSLREFYYLSSLGFNVIFDKYRNNVNKEVLKKVIRKVKHTRKLNIDKVVIYFNNYPYADHKLNYFKKYLGVDVAVFVDDSIEWTTFNEYCTKKSLISKKIIY